MERGTSEALGNRANSGQPCKGVSILQSAPLFYKKSLTQEPSCGHRGKAGFTNMLMETGTSARINGSE